MQSEKPTVASEPSESSDPAGSSGSSGGSSSLKPNQSGDGSAKLFLVYLPRVLVVVVLLMVSLGVTMLLIATKSKSDKNPPETAALLVRTIEVIHRPANRVWSGYGTVQTMNSAQVVAEVGGRVIERPRVIEAGQAVEAGDLIVRLDETDYINALDAARQSLKSIEAQIEGLIVEQEQLGNQVRFAGEEVGASERDLERIDRAIAEGAGSAGERDVKLASLLRTQRAESVLQQQLDLIPSRRAVLEAQRSSQLANERIAKENLERSIIRAPFAGELQTVNVRVGDWAGRGSQVARLVDLSRLEIPLKVAASASSWIKIGDEVRLWVSDPQGDPERVGQVTRIAPEADSLSRTMTIYVEVQQDADGVDRLLPGQFVHGRVVTHDPSERVILPRRAVQSNRVFVASVQENGDRIIEIMPVRIAYSFEARMPEIDPIENLWVAIEIGYEPVEHSSVVISMLDQVIAGMHVRREGDVEVDAIVPAEADAGIESEDPQGDTP